MKTNLIIVFLIFIACKSQKKQIAVYNDIYPFNSELWINDTMGCKGYRNTVIDSIARKSKLFNKYVDTIFIIKYFGKPEFRYIYNKQIIYCYSNNYLYKSPCSPISNYEDAMYNYDVGQTTLDFYFTKKGVLKFFDYVAK